MRRGPLAPPRWWWVPLGGGGGVGGGGAAAGVGEEDAAGGEVAAEGGALFFVEGEIVSAVHIDERIVGQALVGEVDVLEVGGDVEGDGFAEQSGEVAQSEGRGVPAAGVANLSELEGAAIGF